jgi:fructokinase
VACGLVKLGTPTAFVGCVGQDAAGETLVKLLAEIGVDGRGIQRHPTAPTRKVFVVRSAAGDRQFAGFGEFSASEFADAFLKADQLPTDLFETAQFLVIGTLELAYPDSGAAVRRALDLAQAHDTQVLMDVNWRPMFWEDPDPAKGIILDLLPRVHLLKLSAEEADWLFDTRDPAAIHRQQAHLAGVLITDGDRGCTYALADNTGNVPAFSVDVEDTTGAGDSFVAGLLHKLCVDGMASLQSPEQARQAIIFASATGALTTTRAGAIASQPSLAEAEAFLYMNQR